MQERVRQISYFLLGLGGRFVRRRGRLTCCARTLLRHLCSRDGEGGYLAVGVAGESETVRRDGHNMDT